MLWWSWLFRIPPLPQKQRQGWGTRRVVVELAVSYPTLAAKAAGRMGTRRVVVPVDLEAVLN